MDFLSNISENTLKIVFIMVAVVAVGSVLGYLLTKKKVKPQKSETKGPELTLCHVLDVKKGYDERGILLNLAEELKEWTEEAIVNIKLYTIGNQLVPFLIKDIKGNYKEIPEPEDDTLTPELLYRLLECKEVSVPGFFAVPMSGLEKIFSVGALVAIGIVALFIAYVMMNPGG